MKKILIIVFSLCLVGLSVGLYMFNKPLESVSSMKVNYSVNASDLLVAFEEDETTANTKYLDKVLQVEGIVDKLERSEDNTTVYLDAGNPMSNIIFQLEKSEADLQKGDKVTLKGICTGYLMDVVLVRGVKV